MVGDESTHNFGFSGAYPDRLQQMLNRLYKRFEHLDFEERFKRIVEQIEEMDVSDQDRRELLRRLC